MQIGLTAQWSPSVTLPDIRNEVLQVHRAVGSVVAPVVHLAAPVGTHKHYKYQINGCRLHQCHLTSKLSYSVASTNKFFFFLEHFRVSVGTKKKKLFFTKFKY